MSFEEPHLLLVLAMLLWLIFVYKRTASPTSWPKRLGLLVRALVVALVALALARPQVVLPQPRLSLIILADVSQSLTREGLEKGARWVNQVWRDRGEEDLVRIVAFARTPTLVADPNALANPPPPGWADDTDIARALSFAAALVQGQTTGRLVLLTDGRQTKGNALAEAARAHHAGLEVHTVGLDAPPRTETLVLSLDGPDEARPNATFSMETVVLSLAGGPAKISLERDGKILETREVRLPPGTTTLTFEDHLPSAATFKYAVTVEAPGDLWQENNRMEAAVTCVAGPSLLLVDHRPREAATLQAALQAQGLRVTLRGPGGVPHTAEELHPYDLVILSDLSLAGLGPAAGALKSYVQEGGGGLIVAGGERSFGADAYGASGLGALLPVSPQPRGERHRPTQALLLVVDRSGSMSGRKIELAKEAAKAAIEVLPPEDLAGVIAFDSLPITLVKIQPARNRVAMVANLARLRPGGGTNILAALRAALVQFQGVEAKVKHIILLSDGQSSARGLEEVLSSLAVEGITVSTVSVGQGAARRLLDQIAHRTGGRPYYTLDAASVPRIFVREATVVASSPLMELPFRPQQVKAARFLRGIDLKGAPHLLGYVSTRARRGAEVILATPQGEPLLARWPRGLGKVVAYTSDVKGRWATGWLRWPGYPKLWAQLARDTLRSRQPRPYRLTARMAGGQASVTLEGSDDQGTPLLAAAPTLVALSPQGTTQRVNMAQTIPGVYQGGFTPTALGIYELSALDPQGQELATGRLAYSIPEELLLWGLDDQALSALAEAGGGTRDISPAQALAPGAPWPRHHEIWPWLLALALVLLLGEVLLRRVL